MRPCSADGRPLFHREGWRYVFLCLAFAWAAASAVHSLAADIPPEFASPAEEKRYYALIKQFRCLVCQNESLAESQADLAQDLRDQIYAQIRDGRSNEEITGYLVARYGDFVRYRPPLNASTLLLWTGPFLLLVLALVLLVRMARRGRAPPPQLSEAEQEEVRKLTAGKEDS